jgi:predicted lipid-binding transport protein (Tim44 family)
MANSQLLVIVAIAIFAGVILVRLYAVLGRRTGNEREPRDGFRPVARSAVPADSIATLPDLSGAGASGKPVDSVERGLVDIKLADSKFDTDHFVGGAKKAHEIIVTAFAAGERSTLRPLLGDDVYAAFVRVIDQHAARHETVKLTVVGYRDVKIVTASVKGHMAEITIAFTSQVITAILDSTGKVLDGDPANARDVTDVWTFARDTRSRDPNWILVATSGSDI